LLIKRCVMGHARHNRRLFGAIKGLQRNIPTIPYKGHSRHKVIQSPKAHEDTGNKSAAHEVRRKTFKYPPILQHVTEEIGFKTTIRNKYF